ncbi:zinc-binding dehydrogenase [Kitasatospora viridis]|uniref:NADPH:quinone reductase-like Zn-dependent oxidoreductase n=1 Tax=Kitasatospora viridis TaxID=281105 RepID=A0A561UHZ7_9ACTN|nr:zinc-binding dehydrogenase [Kitasatospora viridis]TWF98986.1 NADPH:quinone reductase-like Zn-dependent oxidoreductase [Kitasatospora viridis]
MKAFTATRDEAATVRLSEVPEPQPAADQALVKVEAYSVNRGETFQLERPPGDGWRPGKDVAGLVVQAAPDGSGPAVGSRVVGHPPALGWAEYAAVPTGQLAVLPDRLTVEQAAALPLAGLTALRLLRTATRHTGHLAGRRVLLTGASGGVGHYLTELAAAAGARITAVSSSAERGQRLAELGAVEVVHRVADAEGPFDLVLESTGGADLPVALDRLAKRGLLLWFGQASRQPVTLDFFRLLTGPTSATIRQFSYADVDEPDGADLATLVRLAAEGRLHPELGTVRDWHGTPEVLAELRGRRIRGNAVLTIC